MSRALPLLLVPALLSGAQAQEPADLDALITRLGLYLEQYEQELTRVVADEHYVQQERHGRAPSAGHVAGLPLLRARVTESEVMFLRLPGNAEWFGVRDTKRVDGKAVTGAGLSLADLLARPADDLIERAAAIVEASSRHNLGGRRTINMPTVPLEALSVRNHPRYIFRLRGTARVGRVQTRRLDFEEFSEPTLIESSDGGTLWTRGTAWVEPETGALWRAELTVSPAAPRERPQPGLESRIRVEFGRDDQLQVLVPRELVEQFWIPGGVGQGRGRYSNFRRFTTTGRIIPGS